MKRASWSVHWKTSVIFYEIKSKRRRWRVKTYSRSLFLAPCSDLEWGWSKTRILGQLLLNMLLLHPSRRFYKCPQTQRRLDWEWKKTGKTEGQFKERKEKIKILHIPLVLCFHGNHFHNTVNVASARGAVYVFSDKVAATQKKPREDTERKKRAGKKKGVAQGDKRMSDSG